MAHVNEVLNENLRLWLAAHSNDWDIPILEIYRDYVDLKRFSNDGEKSDVFEVINKVKEDFEAASGDYDEVIDTSRDLPIPGKKGWYYTKSGTGIRLGVFEHEKTQFDKLMRELLDETAGKNAAEAVKGKDNLSLLEKIICTRELTRLTEGREYSGMPVEREALKRVRRKIIESYRGNTEKEVIDGVVLGNILLEEIGNVERKVEERIGEKLQQIAEGGKNADVIREATETSLREAFKIAYERSWLLYPIPMSKEDLENTFEKRKQEINVLYSALALLGITSNDIDETIVADAVEDTKARYEGINDNTVIAFGLAREAIKKGYTKEDYKEFDRVRRATSEKDLEKLVEEKKLPFYLESLVKKDLSGAEMNLQAEVERLSTEDLASRIYHAELAFSVKVQGTQISEQEFTDMRVRALEKVRTLEPNYDGELAKERSKEDDKRAFLRVLNEEMMIKYDVGNVLMSYKPKIEEINAQYKSACERIQSGIKDTRAVLEDPEKAKEISEWTRGILYEFVYGELPKNMLQTPAEQQLIHKKKVALTQLEFAKTQALEELGIMQLSEFDEYFRRRNVRKFALKNGTREPTKDELYSLWKDKMIDIKTHKKMGPGWIENAQKELLGTWWKRRNFYKSELMMYNRVLEEICYNPFEF